MPQPQVCHVAAQQQATTSPDKRPAVSIPAWTHGQTPTQHLLLQPLPPVSTAQVPVLKPMSPDSNLHGQDCVSSDSTIRRHISTHAIAQPMERSHADEPSSGSREHGSALQLGLNGLSHHLLQQNGHDRAINRNHGHHGFNGVDGWSGMQKGHDGSNSIQIEEQLSNGGTITPSKCKYVYNNRSRQQHSSSGSNHGHNSSSGTEQSSPAAVAVAELNHTGQCHARMLAKQLSRCGSLHQLQELHHVTSYQWDALHVVAALSKVVKARELTNCVTPEPPMRYQPLVTALVTAATYHVKAGSYGPRQLTTLLYITAKMRLWQRRVGYELLQALMPRLSNQLQAQPPPAARSSSRSDRQSPARPITPSAKSPSTSRCHVTVSPLDVSLTAWALARMGVLLPCAEPGARNRLVRCAMVWDMDDAQEGDEQEEKEVERKRGAGAHIRHAHTPASLTDAAQASAADDQHHNVHLRIQQLQGQLSGLWAVLLPHVRAHMGRMGPQEISNTMWAMAHSGATYRPSGNSNASTNTFFTHQMEDMQHLDSEDGLEAVASGFLGSSSASVTLPAVVSSGVQVRIDTSVMQQQVSCAVYELAQTAVGLVNRMNRQHVPNVAWAMATMRLRHTELLDTLAQRIIQGSVSGSVHGHAGRVQGELKLHARGVSSLAWAYGCLQFPHPPLHATLTQAAKHKASYFRGQGLSNVIWGLWKMAAAAGKEKRTHMGEQDAAMAAGKLDRELLGLVARESVYKMDEILPLGLATLTGAWAQSGCFNVSLFTAAVTRATQLLPTFKPSTLIHFLSALTRVGHLPLAFLEAAAKHLLPWLAQSVTLATATALTTTAPALGATRFLVPLPLVLSLTEAYGNPKLRASGPCHDVLWALVPTLTAAAVQHKLTPAQATGILVAFSHAGLMITPCVSSQPSAVLQTMAATPVGTAHVVKMPEQHQHLHQHDDLIDLTRHLTACFMRYGSDDTPPPVQLLVSATWALVSMSAPDAGHLVTMCMKQACGSRAAVTRLAGLVSTRWRVRLIEALLVRSRIELQNDDKTTHAQRLVVASQLLMGDLLHDMSQMDLPGLVHMTHVTEQLMLVQDLNHLTASHHTSTSQHHTNAPASVTLHTTQQLSSAPPLAVSHAMPHMPDPTPFILEEVSQRFSHMNPCDGLDLLARLPPGMRAAAHDLVAMQHARMLSWAKSVLITATPQLTSRQSSRTSSGGWGSAKRGRAGIGAAAWPHLETVSKDAMQEQLVSAWKALGILGRMDARTERLLRMLMHTYMGRHELEHVMPVADLTQTPQVSATHAAMPSQHDASVWPRQHGTGSSDATGVHDVDTTTNYLLWPSSSPIQEASPQLKPKLNRPARQIV